MKKQGIELLKKKLKKIMNKWDRMSKYIDKKCPMCSFILPES